MSRISSKRSCTADAPESNSGLFAYLHALYQKALELEARGTQPAPSDRVTLAMRRPDLAILQLDQQALTTEVSALSLIISLLTRPVETVSTEASTPAVAPLNVLAQTTCRADLPYHHHHEQLKAALDVKKLPLLDLLQQTDDSMPGFCVDTLRTQGLRQAMLKSCGLSPELQTFLLQGTPKNEKELLQRYGVNDDSVDLSRLKQLRVFEHYTGVRPEEVCELLAIAGLPENAGVVYDIKRANAYGVSSPASPDNRHYGTRYVQEKRASCIGLKQQGNGTLALHAPDSAELWRMLQVVHLQRALKLPFAEVDLLLMASVKAQKGGHVITPNTLRTIGVFRYLNQTHDVGVEQFCALIGELSAWSRRNGTPWLDHILKAHTDKPESNTEQGLLIDDREFQPDAQDENASPDLVAAKLSKAFGLEQSGTLNLLNLAKRELKLQRFKLSLPLVCSLYRMSTIPRLFNRSLTEGAALMALLDNINPAVTRQLAGAPTINDGEEPDILDVLLALANLDHWLRQQKIAPSALCSILHQDALPRSLLTPSEQPLLQDCLVRLRAMPDPKQQAAREELLTNVLSSLLQSADDNFQLSAAHITAMLKWASIAPEALLDEILQAGRNGEEKLELIDMRRLKSKHWTAIPRYADAIRLLRVNEASLNTLTSNPTLFHSLDTTRRDDSPTTGSTNAAASASATLNLATCYQLTRLKQWLSRCQSNGYDETETIGYLTRIEYRDASIDPAARAEKLASYLGWTPTEGQPLINEILLKPLTCPINDIDYALRIMAACEATGLSCQSLLDLVRLDATSPYDAYQQTADLLLATCSIRQLASIDARIQPAWRDALASYLALRLKPSDDPAASSVRDWLCHYFLADIWCSGEVRTTPVAQAIFSVQQYLHQLCSNLEPGYSSTGQRASDVSQWHQTLQNYPLWRRLQAQYNHPENLIHSRNRPRKSRPFQDLEIDLNSGKLDTGELNRAISSYLSKFEALCNLRVTSGYLDGDTPDHGTFHLIGATHSSPAQYYWRSVDMSLRLTGKAPSPLAWSEWEPIGLHEPGMLTRSAWSISKPTEETEVEDKDESTEDTEVEDKDEPTTENPAPATKGPEELIVIDNIRPLMVSGRKYVFWLERQTPNNPVKNHDVADRERLVVSYVFQQADGTWSTPSEFMEVDQEKLSQAAKAHNTTASLEKFQPGLIVTLNTEGARITDPWLVVMVHGTLPGDATTSIRFLQQTDLSLLPQSPPSDVSALENCLCERFSDPRTVQTAYPGGRVVFESADYDESIGVSDKDYAFFVEPRETAERNDFAIKPILSNERAQLSIQYQRSIKKQFLDSPAADAMPALELLKKTPAGEETLLSQMQPTSDSTTELTHSFDAFEDINLVVRVRIGKIVLNQANFKLQYTRSETDSHWKTTIQTYEQTQFLSTSDRTRGTLSPSLPRIRLNTRLGKTLAVRANLGYEKVLEWETQNLQQPRPDWERSSLGLLQNLFGASPEHPAVMRNAPMDLHGANGLYLHELFLHLPQLVAERLSEQGQYREAEYWYFEYLYHPYQQAASPDGRPVPWRTRPLIETSFDMAPDHGEAALDPTLLAYLQTSAYQHSVVLGIIDNWQLQGDHHYRLQSRSDLTLAWRCYDQAAALLARHFSDDDLALNWKPVQLHACNSALFVQPRNPRIDALRRTVANRLFNLRHGLSLNGQKITRLAWNPHVPVTQALQAGAISVRPQTPPDVATPPSTHRFRQLLPIARSAAQQLLDMGRHYLHLTESDTDNQLDVLLLRQALKMSDFTLRLEKEAVNLLQAQRNTLMANRDAAIERRDYYRELLSAGLSQMEGAATLISGLVSAGKTVAAGQTVFEGAAKLLPNIFGVAAGGMKWEAGFTAAKECAELLADAATATVDHLMLVSEFERRNQEWQFEQRQAELDLTVLDREAIELEVELAAATISLQSAGQERANLDETYAFVTSGFNVVPVYQWMVARQELIYGAAYDAVLSICQAAQAAWYYEIGDYTREPFVKNSGWSDTYKGMLAGESLLVDLQEMENAYLSADERRLCIRKTISLKKLLGEDWDTTSETLCTGKPISFQLKSPHFDKNYPGHYQRQIKQVSVSFNVDAGDDLGTPCAILTQTANSLLTSMDAAGLDYLYGKSETVPASVIRNLRTQQQIALSSLSRDDGLGHTPEQWVYTLMFHDDRYLPFEGTGVISEWTLQIPDMELAKAMGEVLEDIQLTLVYTAKNGDGTFTERVIGMMSESSEQTSVDVSTPEPQRKTDKDFPTYALPDGELT